MEGLMMNRPLSILSLLQFAAANHAEARIVSKTGNGSLHSYTYADCYRRVSQLASALRTLGVAPGDRIATLAWNTHRHFELYYAISGCGAVCHTINPRLALGQIQYIINHARDRLIFVDTSFVSLLEAIKGETLHVEGIVVMCHANDMPSTSLTNVHCFEDLVCGHSDGFAWPDLDENTASSLCYSSGTTGEPKGTLYSHRSTVLHALAACFPDNFGYSSNDTVLPLGAAFPRQCVGCPVFVSNGRSKPGFPRGKARCGLDFRFDGRSAGDLCAGRSYALGATARVSADPSPKADNVEENHVWRLGRADRVDPGLSG